MLSAWYNSWWWFPTLILATIFTVLVFPTGRLLSARWRPVAWLTAAITATILALTALAPTLDLGQRTKLGNPIGLAWIPNPEQSALGPVLLGLLLVCTGAAVVSLVAAVPSLSRGGTPAAQVVHLCRGPVVLLVDRGLLWFPMSPRSTCSLD
jgi:hypothetical protein